MILFNSMDGLVAFLSVELPKKIITELFYEAYYFESKGKKVKNQRSLSPFFIIEKLKEYGFIQGLASKPEKYKFPDQYVLHWSKFKKFLKENDTLIIEQGRFRLLSINDACEILGVTRPTLYKLVNEHELPIIQIFSQKKIQLKDLVDYMDKNKKYI